MSHDGIHGRCHEAFRPLADAFAANFDEGLELGASLAVTHGDDVVLDLHGGWANPARTRPWQEDSITCVYSTTKIMTVLATLVLVDRGLLDLDAPIARYWPEFAAQGKQDIPVRWIFSHSTGIAGWDDVIEWTDLFDWQPTVDRLAAQAPWWEPGTASGYHMLTFGFLLGELVRRIDGRTVGTFLREGDYGAPLRGFWLGLPESEHRRIATQEQKEARDMQDFTAGAFWPRVNASPVNIDYGSVGARTSEIPSANGYGNALGVARMGALLANRGSFAGHRLLSPATVELALEEQSYRRDLVLDEPMRLGLGLGLDSAEFNCPSDRTLHWGGYGGSICVMDTKHRVCCAYVMNLLHVELLDDERTTRVREALNECIVAIGAA